MQVRFAISQQPVHSVPRMIGGGKLTIWSDIVDGERYLLTDKTFQKGARDALNINGVLALDEFIRPDALSTIQAEAKASQSKAYFCTDRHSVYLTPLDPAFSKDHPANRQVVSSKGCICDDDVPADSPLRALYNAHEFQAFVSAATGQGGLFPYADPLSSINVHYAKRGQELGWHFDNSAFAVTLLIQKPEAGARFEYVSDLRNCDTGEKNYAGVEQVLDGVVLPKVIEMDPGTLLLFRGRNALHRVTPNEGDRVRMLAVLAYNETPGVSLSENARMTFYGRLS